jgi:hypothetical protein
MTETKRHAAYAILSAALLFQAPGRATAQTEAEAAPPAATVPVAPTAPVTAAAPAPAAAAVPAVPPLPRSFWGWGIGYVFTEVPISQSEFSVFMSQLYYSYYLSDPSESMRTALSMGLYGFALVLPVPKVSAEFYLGKSSQEIQGKFGVGGFYDIAVGGHAGISGEMGIRIKDKVDFSFFVVPTGIDSKRDYLDFMGLRDEDEIVKKPYVIFPYFGLFVSFKY